VQPTRVWTAQPDGPAAEDRPNRPAYVQIGERRGGGDLAGALVQALQPAGPIALAVGVAGTRQHPDCTGVHGQPVREAGHPQGGAGPPPSGTRHSRAPSSGRVQTASVPTASAPTGRRRLAVSVTNSGGRARSVRASTLPNPSSCPRAGSNTTTAPQGCHPFPLWPWSPGAPTSPAPKFWPCRRPTTIRATSITTTPATSRQLRLDAFTPTPRPSVRPFC
jgi:hypothetical protein